MSKQTETIKETMKQSVTNLVSAYVITQLSIHKLEDTINETEKLLNQFKL